MPFADAAAKAIEAADQDLTNETHDTETATGDNSERENSQETSDEPRGEPQTKSSNQAILDLAKVEKFVVEGQEMTFDELKRAMLRQQDYTKKTQALAEERKFIDNLDVDLENVRQNPALVAKFKEIYPARFHRYLDYISANQSEKPTSDTKQSVSLPPEVLRKLEEHEEFLKDFQQDKMNAQQEQLSNFWDGLEKGALEKYPLADKVHIYGMLENYIQDNGLNAKTILSKRDVSTQLFEQFAKASHDAQSRRFDEYRKTQLEKTRKVNREAGDIGKGGGTPTTPPQKMRIKDVADQMIQDLANS